MKIYVCFIITVANATASTSTTSETKDDESEDLNSEPKDITPIGVEFLGQKFGNMKFPQDNSKYKRSFQPKWCATYTWIEYSVSRDAIFCNVCRNFALKKNRLKDQTFIVHGYRNWSNACIKSKGLAMHEQSLVHRNALLNQIESKQRVESNAEVSELLNSAILEKRRYYIGSIVDIIILLSSRELAFRGNWDKEACNEDGLFNALFKFALERDEKLIKCHDIMPRNAVYTSPIIQNELISILVQCTRDKMVQKINTSEYLTLFADGTKDRNGLEVISIALRYVIDCMSYESLIGMETTDDLSAKAIGEMIAKSLKLYGVNVNKIIAQCYDGANVMSGGLGGVQAVISGELRREIPYIHCFNHQLHLVIKKVCDAINDARIFFDQIQMIYKFFKKYRVTKVYEGSKLKKLIETRWAGHIKSTVAVYTNYEEIISALDAIRLSTETENAIKFDGDEIATAGGIYTTATTLKFLFLTHMFMELLQLIQPADTMLQSREVGYRAAMPLINSLIKDIENFKTDVVFNRILSSVVAIRQELDLTEPVRRGRPPAFSPEDLLKRLFHNCVGVVLNELKARFTEFSDILIAASCAAETNFEYESLQPLAKIINLPEEWELRSAKAFTDRQNAESEKQSQSALQMFDSVKLAFPNVYKMLEAVETIGCSTAVNEASFSSLARVDTINRMSMSNERLRNLTFLAFEAKEVHSVDKMTIIRAFHNAKDRKVQLF